MKKFFITIVVCFVGMFSMTSCSNGDNKSNVCRNVTEFNYKGHDYIRFESGYGSGRTWSVVHNPDCKCHVDSIN